MHHARIAVMGFSVAVLGLITLGAGACSSTTDSNGGCKIEGTYTVTSQYESGNCAHDDAKLSQPSTYVVINNNDGTVEIQAPGLSGSCTGKIDGCKVNAGCDVTSGAGKTVIGTYAIAWTFDSSGLKGIESLSISAAPSCSLTVEDTGTRR